MMSAMAEPLQQLRPLGITLLRMALGVIFLFHGLTKVLALQQWTHNFVHMGFPGWVAYLIGPLETVGGVLLILGLFSRIAGLLLAGDLLVAVITVHLPRGPIWHVNDYELQMLLSAASFWIFCYGGGPWSLDRTQRRA